MQLDSQNYLSHVQHEITITQRQPRKHAKELPVQFRIDKKLVKLFCVSFSVFISFVVFHISRFLFAKQWIVTIDNLRNPILSFPLNSFKPLWQVQIRNTTITMK